LEECIELLEVLEKLKMQGMPGNAFGNLRRAVWEG